MGWFHQIWTFTILFLLFHRLFGCYEALDGGDLGEALEDFTGGVADQIDLAELGLVDKPEERTAFFARLQKEVDRKSLLAASIPVSFPICTGDFFCVKIKKKMESLGENLVYEPPRGKTNNVVSEQVSEQVRHKPACTVTEKS